MHAPRWSVVITTYQRPDMLRHCLSAVLAALPADGEVLVSDDSPRGEGEAVCAAFPDAPLSYHRNPTNLGIVGNVNGAISRSRGEVIHWCADDDWPALLFYREMAALPVEAEVGHCQYVNHYPDGALWSPPPMLRKPGLIDPATLVTHWRRANWTHMVATVFRRSVWDNLGGFDPAFPLLHDWHFLLRAALAGSLHWYTPRPLARYRVHEASATNLGMADRAAELARFHAEFAPCPVC